MRQFASASIIALACTLTPACDSPPSRSHPPTARPDSTRPLLAAARSDLAASRLAAEAPDEALALAVSALHADPTSLEARSIADRILATTRWHLPDITLDHHAPIDHLEFAPPTALWVSLSGDANTTVRWNLQSLLIEQVLFPILAPATRSMVFDPTHHAVVIERAGTSLLCDAQTLKPIRNLGPLPPFVTPAAAIAFTTDGLLLAHPTGPPLTWQLRDTASGELIRSAEPADQGAPPPLAAYLDHHALRVLRTDASLFEMPVSPVQPITVAARPGTPLTLLHAQFAAHGDSALTLTDRGPHLCPAPLRISLGGPPDASLEPSSLLERQPWSRHPSIWTGLLRAPEHPLLQVEDHIVRIRASQHAPLLAASAVTAVAASGNQIAIGEANGTLTIYRTLPIPLMTPTSSPPAAADPNSLTALDHLTTALTGVLIDPTSRQFARATPPQREQAFNACNFTALRGLFPTLDFSPTIAALPSIATRTSSPEALRPLTERLARAAAPTSSARQALEPIFESGDDTAVIAAIRASGSRGASAASALELALASSHPAWIIASLAQAVDLPPLLRHLAESRIAWLQDRKADALAQWPVVFPDYHEMRLQQDWDGWEQADFSQAMENLHLCMNAELDAIKVPANPTPAQRQAVADRLGDPATLKTVGRDRFAEACLHAALAMAAFKDAKETTFTLAARARELGAPPAPCLRAEAIALTALGDYQHAHDRWISLITDNPLDTQQPGDYAEAAYTAFENSNPHQAMAILTTGLHRFPNDSNFALRAGWVALLTGNAERAYRFLLAGRQIGYPAAKLENATALLAIAAAQTGAAEDAAAFYQDLIRLDDDWRKPTTLESLEWPEELKASLRQVAW